MNSGQKVWAKILSGLKAQISPSTYRTWFGGSRVLDLKKSDERDILIIGVKNNFIKEQLETRYRLQINTVAEKNGFSGEVVFIVSKEETDKPAFTTPLFSGEAPVYFGTVRKNESINPAHNFERFVTGPSNNLAYLAFSQTAQNPGHAYNPLFVWGPTGVGKTHLMQAVANEILNKSIDAKVLYASAEKFTNDYIESLNSRTTAAFRQKYRGVDVLLVDDIQFFAGKESTQDEFFYTFNELYMSGRQIIVAADRHPKDLGKLQDRLASRLMGGMTVDIQLPDVELRAAILKARCKEKGVALSNEIIDYIANVCGSGARELEGTLVQVLALLRLSSGLLTLEQVKRSVENNLRDNKPKPTPGKVIEAVSRHFRLSSGDLCGPKRKASFVRARQVLMYLLRKDLGLPLEGVGDITGGRDHSTVLYGVEKVEGLVAVDQSQRDEISRIRAIFQQ